MNLGKNKGGRPRLMSPNSKNKIRNGSRIYLGQEALPKWKMLKEQSKLTDMQLINHLMDIHQENCHCSGKSSSPPPPTPIHAVDPWDRSSLPKVVRGMPLVSTPRKPRVTNQEADMDSTHADLSFSTDQSLICTPVDHDTVVASPVNEDDPEVINADVTRMSPVRDESVDDIPETIEADLTRATLGDVPDMNGLDDDLLDMSLPETFDDIPGPEIGDDSVPAIEAQKCIAFVDSICQLVEQCTGKVCQRCQTRITVTPTMYGTALCLRWKCEKGHVGEWSSQPKVGNRIYSGNFQLATNILLSGNAYNKIALLFKFMNIGCIQNAFFYQVQRHYALPAIEKFWTNMQTDIITKILKRDGGLVVAGDGRNDSPGHSAKYCTYTLMDVESKQIVHIEVVDIRESANSVVMERIGFVRAMDSLSQKVPITEVVTDQSPTIGTVMKTRYPHVEHQCDIWHAARNLEKRLLKLGNTKNFELLRIWAPALKNHFWYCSKECGGDAEVLKNTWVRVLHHVCNQHEWAGGKCGHPPLDDDEDDHEKPWFDPASPAMDQLRDLVYDRKFIGAMKHFTNFRHTGDLECFHNQVLMYAPKRVPYKFPGYRTRTLAAAIDFNYHINRPIQTDDEGDERHKPYFNKKSKGWGMKNLKTDKSYGYIVDLQAMVFDEKAKDSGPMRRSGAVREDDPRRLAQNISKVPCPPRKELLEKHKSRF